MREPLWVERYRPTKIEDCILKTDAQRVLSSIVEDGHVPNMLFYGPPGTGKTTAAKALCQELGLDWTVVNASNERGLDMIREKIYGFASTVSLGGNGKCFILDEADYLTPNAQSALRAASEELSSNCSFVMTANYPNRIIEALHSRFTGMDFSASKQDSERMQAEFFFRLTEILFNESVEYDERVLAEVVSKFFPDNRKILNKLQHYAKGGNVVDEGILMEIEEVNLDSLIAAIKDKKFNQVKQWAADNKDNDTSILYEGLYQRMRDIVVPDSIPDAIMILEEAQRYDAIVPSKELHLASTAVELMMGVDFK
jgi:DNA polymerase III delta prime subunit